MKKTRFFLLTVLIALSFFNTCKFSVEKDTNVSPNYSDSSGYMDYLAFLKYIGNNKVTEVELQKMVEKLINSDDNMGRNTAPLAAATVTGSKKLNLIEGRHFAISNTARAAGITEEEPVQIYCINTNRGEKNGFVIACDDRRVGNILAVIDSGRFENNEDNPFINIFLNQLEMYIDGIIAMYEIITQENIEAVLEKVMQDDQARKVLDTDAIHEKGTNEANYWTQNGNRDIDIDYYLGTYYLYDKTGLINHYLSPYNYLLYSAEWEWTDGYYTPIPVEWGQGGVYTDKLKYTSPYNAVINYPGMVKDTKNETIHNAKNYIIAGCAPVAIAQLMAYHRHPPTCTFDLAPYKSDFGPHNQYSYDWIAMTKESTIPATPLAPTKASESVGILIWEIGKRGNAKYVPNGVPDGPSTGMNNNQEINALIAMGYIVPSSSYTNIFGYKDFKKYSYSNIKASITLGRPVLISGRNNKNEGHLWIIDGTRSMSYMEKYKDAHGNIIAWINNKQNFIHCNLGWNSYGNNDGKNGWYISGIFDTAHLSFARSTSEHDFSDNIKILTHVYH